MRLILTNYYSSALIIFFWMYISFSYANLKVVKEACQIGDQNQILNLPRKSFNNCSFTFEQKKLIFKTLLESGGVQNSSLISLYGDLMGFERDQFVHWLQSEASLKKKLIEILPKEDIEPLESHLNCLRRMNQKKSFNKFNSVKNLLSTEKETNGLLLNLYSIGFSKNGLFAYMQKNNCSCNNNASCCIQGEYEGMFHYRDSSCGAQEAISITIFNLISDKNENVLDLTRNFSASDIDQYLKKYKIVETDVKLEQFPITINEEKFTVTTQPDGPPEVDIQALIYLHSNKKGVKKVGRTFGCRIFDKVFGFLKSPFEERILLITKCDNFWHGDTTHVFNIFGTSLIQGKWDKKAKKYKSD